MESESIVVFQNFDMGQTTSGTKIKNSIDAPITTAKIENRAHDLYNPSIYSELSEFLEKTSFEFEEPHLISQIVPFASKQSYDAKNINLDVFYPVFKNYISNKSLAPSLFSKNFRKNYFNSYLTFNPVMGEAISPISKRILSLQTKFESIKELTTLDALNFLNEEPSLIDPAYEYVKTIKTYLNENIPVYDMEVILQQDQHESEFKVLIVYIQADIEDIELELELTDNIGNLLDELDKEILENEGYDLTERLSNITFILEGID